jgi:hypothetical protein
MASDKANVIHETLGMVTVLPDRISDLHAGHRTTADLVYVVLCFSRIANTSRNSERNPCCGDRCPPGFRIVVHTVVVMMVQVVDVVVCP